MQDIIQMWRDRIVQQFEKEKRGSEYTINGTLVQRNDGRTFTPHYERPITHNYWKPSTPEEEIYGYLGKSAESLNVYTPGIEFPKKPEEDKLKPKLFYFLVSTVVAFLFVKRKNIFFCFNKTTKKNTR